MTTTIYLGSTEEREMCLPDPKVTGLARSLVMAVLSPKAVTLPSYIGRRLGVRANVLSFPMVKPGFKPDLDQGNFRCLVLALNLGRKESVVLAFSLADDFPRSQKSVVCPLQSLKLFDRDVHEASRIYYGSVLPDLPHELTLLCKSQVLDARMLCSCRWRTGLHKIGRLVSWLPTTRKK